MKNLPVRKNIRLKGYDYSSAGYYFITICTKNKIEWFGEIPVGQGLCSCRPSITCCLTEIGRTAEIELKKLENRYNILRLDKYVIMPNHIHAIIVLEEQHYNIGGERREQSPRPTTLMDAVCAFKSITAKEFNRMNDTSGGILWQSRFHDHIIRNENEYQRIWQYIDTNPAKWETDCFYINR